MTDDKPEVRHYTAQYGNFASQLYADVRAETFGEDIGQNGWQTRDEQDLFISWLGLGEQSRLLDIACGSGGPTLRIARKTKCTVVGVDAHGQGIAEARARAESEGLSERAAFEHLDASQPMPFADGSFDGIICIDAVNHLPNRQAVFQEWARLLPRGGHLVFTDPIVVTGHLTNEEIAIRSSIGFFLFVPPGLDEQLLEGSGFEISDVLDRTENMAEMARRWRDARESRSDDLRQIEGDETFEGQQRFFDVAATIAADRRLSRFAFHARRK